MPRTIPDSIAARTRQRLVVGDEPPSPTLVKIRWLILRRHRANSPTPPTPTGGAAMPAPKVAA